MPAHKDTRAAAAQNARLRQREEYRSRVDDGPDAGGIDREAALRVATAKWGRAKTYLENRGMLCIVREAFEPGGFESMNRREGRGRTWEEACQDAGLLP